MKNPSPERQDLEQRLATLVEMAQRSPEDGELGDLIHIARNNLAANEAHPEATGQMLINTSNLIDYHIHIRQHPPGP